jgi:hypothetical protein
MAMEPTEAEEIAYEYLSAISAANRLMEKTDCIEDAIKIQIICKFITFNNAHLVANNLVKENKEVAQALSNELLAHLQIKDIKC